MCSLCIVNLVWSSISHCVKYISAKKKFKNLATVPFKAKIMVPAQQHISTDDTGGSGYVGAFTREFPVASSTLHIDSTIQNKSC
jgi:hypothetical protein